MSFFEPPPPPEPPPATPQTPEWFGPPDNVLAAAFPLDLVIARTEELALFVHSGHAYEKGFEFTFGLRRRTPPEGNGHDPMTAWYHMRGTRFDDSVLRFGVAFADGRKATVFDRHPWSADPEGRDHPDIVLMQRGGGGGGSSWDFRFWVWPLPAEGPVAFVTEWPSEGIALVRAQVDSAVIREAALRAVTLWPGTGPGAGGGAWTTRRA